MVQEGSQEIRLEDGVDRSSWAKTDSLKALLAEWEKVRCPSLSFPDVREVIYRRLPSLLPPEVTPTGLAVIVSLVLIETAPRHPYLISSFEDAGGFFYLSQMVGDAGFIKRSNEVYGSLMGRGRMSIFG